MCFPLSSPLDSFKRKTFPVLPLSRCMAITKNNSQTRSRTWGCSRRRAPVLPWTARTRTTIPSVKVMGLSSKGMWTRRRYRLGRVAGCPLHISRPPPSPRAPQHSGEASLSISFSLALFPTLPPTQPQEMSFTKAFKDPVGHWTLEPLDGAGAATPGREVKRNSVNETYRSTRP